MFLPTAGGREERGAAEGHVIIVDERKIWKEILI
jgi:hypothetical protein